MLPKKLLDSKLVRDASLDSIDFWDKSEDLFLGGQLQLHVWILDCKICDVCFIVQKKQFPHTCILHLFLWILALLLLFSPWFLIYEPRSCGWENKQSSCLYCLCFLSSLKWKRRFSKLKRNTPKMYLWDDFSWRFGLYIYINTPNNK